jgi:hypothetical protein
VASVVMLSSVCVSLHNFWSLSINVTCSRNDVNKLTLERGKQQKQGREDMNKNEGNM